MSYELPYVIIRESVKRIVASRLGMNNAKNAFTTRRIVAELTGYFIDIVEELEIPTPVVAEYFRLVENHNFKALPRDGKVYFVHDFIDPLLAENPLYYPMETILMNFKPASVQVGTGEFFFCWYDKDSVFGIDNQLTFDVKVNGLELELKGLNSNLTASEEKFDEYMEICDGIMVVGSYENRNEKGLLKNAQTRSIFCINTTDWRESFEFKGQSLRLINQTEILNEKMVEYKQAKVA